MEIRNKNVTEAMYYSDFWIKLCKKSKDILLREDEIRKLDEESFKKGYLTNIFQHGEELTKEYIKESIKSISKVPEDDRYKGDIKLSKEYYDQLEDNMNLDNIEDIKQKYGIVVKRGKLKIFPADDRVFKEENGYELDRFMESAVYIGEPCVIYTLSKDGEFYFCKTYNSIGWLHRDYLAIASKEKVQEFSNSKDFIVVTGRKIILGYNPFIEDLSEETLDMGIRLPLVKAWDIEDTVYDMYTEGNYIVKYPLRDEEGKLQLTNILIPYGEDVHEGYLKCKRSNILKQVFKFQGERYGWGGEFESRDCSSMIVDVFRTFGINFPRNTGEQLKKSVGKTMYFDESTPISEKQKIIDSLKVGSLVYLSGHVVMVVGKYKEKTYVIHDVIGVHVEEEGELIYLPTRGVTVSSLSDIYTSGKVGYIEGAIGVKDIFS